MQRHRESVQLRERPDHLPAMRRDGQCEAAEKVKTFNSLEVASMTGASQRQLQWWDERGVLKIRQERHRRCYSDQDVRHVNLIIALRKKGISLQKVRAMLPKITDDHEFAVVFKQRLRLFGEASDALRFCEEAPGPVILVRV